MLSRAQKRILEVFGKLPDASRFYLTGGTALAEFYLGHRRSFDLDLFTTERGIILSFSRIVEEELRQQSMTVQTIRRLESFVEFEVSWKNEPVRVQLAYDSPYRFAPPVETPLGRVNDYEDLVVDKLLAFFGRAEPRDAVDLYCILKAEDFWQLVQLAGQKDTGFDLYWLAVALQKVEQFPGEITRWPVELFESIEAPVLKRRFHELVKEIMDRLKPKPSP